MKNLVLILTNENDEHTEPVIEHLENLGQRSYRFNTETFPLKTTLKLTLSEGVLRPLVTGGETVDLAIVKSVWYRRPAPPFMASEAIGEGYARFIKNESNTALWSLYTTLEAFWVNPPLMGSHLLQHNKFYQLKGASSVGLKVPDTIITNDPEELLRFSEMKGGVVAVKLLKGDWFLKGGSPVPLFVFTQRVTSTQIAECFEDIKLSPVLAQEYVEKELELRVTIVGKKVFACAIHSQDSEQTKIDWRNYDLEHVKHESYQLPREVETKLLAIMGEWHLSYGAVDMIVTPAGEHVFLEINPSGQWLWIEERTGMPISQALAELLSNPPPLSG